MRNLKIIAIFFTSVFSSTGNRTAARRSSKQQQHTQAKTLFHANCFSSHPIHHRLTARSVIKVLHMRREQLNLQQSAMSRITMMDCMESLDERFLRRQSATINITSPKRELEQFHPRLLETQSGTLLRHVQLTMKWCPFRKM